MGHLRDWEGGAGGPDGARLIEKPTKPEAQGLTDGLDWVSLDEAAEELRVAEAVAHNLVDLLAWVLREVAAPSNLGDPSNWPPGLWVTDWPDTWEAALRDPVVFDLARQQVASDLLLEPDRDLNPVQEANLIRQAAILLRTERPSQMGKRRGGRAVEYLTARLAEWIRAYDPRGDGPIADARLAAAICESLTAHPLLSDFPEAVRTAEAIRADLGRIRVGS